LPELAPNLFFSLGATYGAPDDQVFHKTRRQAMSVNKAGDPENGFMLD